MKIISLPGYTHVFVFERTFANDRSDRGIIQTNQFTNWDGQSLVVIDLTIPDGAAGARTLLVSEYDPDAPVELQWGCIREIGLSTAMGDFENVVPYGHKESYNASLPIHVGGRSVRGVAQLGPGRYFINIRWPQASDARISM